MAQTDKAAPTGSPLQGKLSYHIREFVNGSVNVPDRLKKGVGTWAFARSHLLVHQIRTMLHGCEVLLNGL